MASRQFRRECLWTAQVGLISSLLDLLISSCRIEKAFLFDVVSKIYIATDSSPVDMQSYELWCVVLKTNVFLRPRF